MICFGADENFSGRVYDALRRADPNLDLIRAQDVGLSGAPDEEVLAWAAAEGRVLLTSDRRTLFGLAYDRVRRGLPMPGVVVARSDAPIGTIVHDIRVLAVVSEAEEWEWQIIYLPL